MGKTCRRIDVHESAAQVVALEECHLSRLQPVAQFDDRGLGREVRRVHVNVLFNDFSALVNDDVH